eukprot:11515069-Ditylum_brightwellii.AAC.2
MKGRIGRLQECQTSSRIAWCQRQCCVEMMMQGKEGSPEPFMSKLALLLTGVLLAESKVLPSQELSIKALIEEGALIHDAFLFFQSGGIFRQLCHLSAWAL